MPIIESIPNISEGRRPDVVGRIVDAVRNTPGIRVLDHSSDGSHNRTVITLVGGRSPMKAAILALYEAVVPAVDLRTHSGEHPRVGAVNVVPFVPIEDVTMADCVALARKSPQRWPHGSTFRISVRRGVGRTRAKEPRRHPPRRVRGARCKTGVRWMGAGLRSRRPTRVGWCDRHRCAHAASSPTTSIWNTDRLDVARKIAAAIRHSSGGLRSSRPWV